MRVLLVADIHYALKQLDWVLAVAPRFEVVVIAGDLLEIASSVDRRAQIVVVETYLKRLSQLTRVVVCSGNHDLDGVSPSGEQRADWLGRLGHLDVHADGASSEIGGAKITICPWWDGAESKGQIAAQLARDAGTAPGHWIWAYHAPPAGSPVSWGGSRHFGDQELRDWIMTYQPDMVLSGHVHQSPFVRDGSWVDRIGRSWVFNCGQQPGPEPAHVVLDLAQNRAVWISMEGAEEIDLAAQDAAPQPMQAPPDWITGEDPLPAAQQPA